MVDWETRVVQKEKLLGEILFLGALLLLVWAGLRFGDLQRSNFSALNRERGILRGNSWRTKVTDAGRSWGANAFGLSGRPPNWGWAHVWFAAFATWVLALPTPLQLQVDYLLPDMILETTSGGPRYRIFARPMPYIKALNMFRITLARVHTSLGLALASAKLRPRPIPCT